MILVLPFGHPLHIPGHHLPGTNLPTPHAVEQYRRGVERRERESMQRQADASPPSEAERLRRKAEAEARLKEAEAERLRKEAEAAAVQRAEEARVLVFLREMAKRENPGTVKVYENPGEPEIGSFTPRAYGGLFQRRRPPLLGRAWLVGDLDGIYGVAFGLMEDGTWIGVKKAGAIPDVTKREPRVRYNYRKYVSSMYSLSSRVESLAKVAGSYGFSI